ARGVRGHAGDLGRQAGDAVEGPPELEGAGALVVLGLDEHGPACHRVEGPRGEHRGPVGHATEARRGRLDVLRFDDHWWRGATESSSPRVRGTRWTEPGRG